MYIDNKLNFGHHVSHICQKAGKQVKVVGRLSRVLNLSIGTDKYAENSASETIYLQSVVHNYIKLNNSPCKINLSLDLPLKNCAR